MILARARQTTARSQACGWLAGACVAWGTFAASCAAPADRLEPLLRWQAPSAATLVLQADTKIGGVAAGDLDDFPGDEVVAVAGDGGVWVARWEAGAWRAERIHRLPGEAIGVALLPTTSAQRGFVTVGKQSGDEDAPGPGAATLFTCEGADPTAPEAWRIEPLLQDEALLHGIDAGPEGLALAGYSQLVHWLAPAPGGLQHRVVGHLPGPAKGVAWQGPGRIVVACASGELVRFTRSPQGGEPWAREILWRYPDALARVDTLAQQIAVCSNDGGLYFYRPGWTRDSVVYRSSDRLRGALFLEGPETELGAPWFLATAGYDGRVSLLPRFGAGEAAARHLQVDEQRLHHLAGGQVDYGESPGLVPTLFACGYSGRVLALPFRSTGR